MARTPARKGLTIRFSPEEMAHMDALAEKYGVSQATIIRWALEALVAYVEAHGGALHLPIDLSAQWTKTQRRPK